jgi:hypothetical protein
MIKNRYTTKLKNKKKPKEEEQSMGKDKDKSSTFCSSLSLMESEKSSVAKDSEAEVMDELAYSNAVPMGAKRAWNGNLVVKQEEESKEKSEKSEIKIEKKVQQQRIQSAFEVVHSKLRYMNNFIGSKI